MDALAARHACRAPIVSSGSNNILEAELNLKPDAYCGEAAVAPDISSIASDEVLLGCVANDLYDLSPGHTRRDASEI